MGFFDIFIKDNKLKEDFILSEYFDADNHSGYMYIASQHCVQKRVVIPDGPQGYFIIKIPQNIKTKEKLYKFLIQKHKFTKKANLNSTKTTPTKNTPVPIIKVPVNSKPQIYTLFNIIENETTSISVDIFVESGDLIARKNSIIVYELYSVICSPPMRISYTNFHEYLQQAPMEIQEKYRNFSEKNWKEFIPSNYDTLRFCDCSSDKRHSFVSFGTHKNSCIGTPTNYTVHRCYKCGYIHKDFFVPSELGKIVEKTVKTL